MKFKVTVEQGGRTLSIIHEYDSLEDAQTTEQKYIDWVNSVIPEANAGRLVSIVPYDEKDASYSFDTKLINLN